MESEQLENSSSGSTTNTNSNKRTAVSDASSAKSLPPPPEKRANLDTRKTSDDDAERLTKIAGMLNYPNKLPKDERTKVMVEYKTLKYDNRNNSNPERVLENKKSKRVSYLFLF